MRNTKFWKLLLRCSGIAVFLLIFYKIDVQYIFHELSNINWFTVSPLFLIFLGLSYFKTKRWELLLFNSHIATDGKNLFVIYVASFLIGAITPGRIGEIMKYKLVADARNDTHVGLVLAVQDRIWDLCFTLIVGASFLVYLSPHPVFVLFFLPAVLGLVAIAMYPEVSLRILGKGLSSLFPHAIFPRRLKDLAAGMVRLSFRNHLQCLGLTCLSWMTYFTQVNLLFRATGLQYHVLFVSGVVASAGLVALLPISVAGLGTRDAALVGLFSLAGYPAEPAVVLSACILMIFLANCVLSLPFWMYIGRSLGTLSYSE